eukprot:CAMPEP_0116907484 /NCGR_PEP_ID=MMETSP0467-20121206/13140_1 /TAXON_ID=283647 /ORGANISM="Mesodinium pulex, Strain SPMC105" /LENGTH=57 /DNA_ID=CAMNT_0004582525 /DNA_START=2272 /DNA_END=2445 /DNA_ORIENTATION=+
MGDWAKVSELCQQGVGDDELHNLAQKMLGDFYSDKMKYDKASEYYIASNSYTELVDA